MAPPQSAQSSAARVTTLMGRIDSATASPRRVSSLGTRLRRITPLKDRANARRRGNQESPHLQASSAVASIVFKMNCSPIASVDLQRGYIFTRVVIEGCILGQADAALSHRVAESPKDRRGRQRR